MRKILNVPEEAIKAVEAAYLTNECTIEDMSNYITDLTVSGASKEDIAKAVEKSIFVMDGVPEDLFVVWSVKVLQNWKALVSAPGKGVPYYEVTHNGDTGQTYVDVYEKKLQAVLGTAKHAEEEN